MGGGNTIFPRRKAGRQSRTSVKPVVLTNSELAERVRPLVAAHIAVAEETICCSQGLEMLRHAVACKSRGQRVVALWLLDNPVDRLIKDSFYRFRSVSYRWIRSRRGFAV